MGIDLQRKLDILVWEEKELNSYLNEEAKGDKEDLKMYLDKLKIKILKIRIQLAILNNE